MFSVRDLRDNDSGQNGLEGVWPLVQVPGCVVHPTNLAVFNRPGVAGAVFQTASSFIHSLINPILAASLELR